MPSGLLVTSVLFLPWSRKMLTYINQAANSHSLSSKSERRGERLQMVHLLLRYRSKCYWTTISISSHHWRQQVLSALGQNSKEWDNGNWHPATLWGKSSVLRDVRLGIIWSMMIFFSWRQPPAWFWDCFCSYKRIFFPNSKYRKHWEQWK